MKRNKIKLIVITTILITLVINMGCDNINKKETKGMPEQLKTKAIDKSQNGILSNYLTNMNISDSEAYNLPNILTSHTEAWVLKVLEDNPGLFEGFQNPSNNTIGKTMWHGEFPGKILTGIAQTYITNKDERVLSVGNKFVQYLKQSQQQDGYLGPWPDDVKFNKDSINAKEGAWGKWDTWGHYHCIYGLYRWYQATGNEDALNVAKKALDCIYDYFIVNEQTFASQKWGECNYAISHMFALMYEQTKEDKYLNAAEHIVNNEWKQEYLDFYTKKIIKADWIESALNGIVFGKSNQPRWESLYTLSTLGTLYKVTGKEEYYKALDALWWGMVGYDRHNIGSFGSGEGATGDPYGTMSETCNTVAWSALSTEYLKASKNSYVADELEMSYYNAILGSLNGDNRIFSYANYSNGTRDAANVTLEGHSYINAPDMSCCQASGTRGLSSISEWAVLTDKTGLYLNYYGDSKLETYTADGNRVILTQETDYPKSGSIKIKVESEEKQTYAINIRIPVWSNNTTVKLNGKAIETKAGTYCTLTNEWDNDVIEIELDMSLHFWVAEKTSAFNNKVSIYFGPLLLGAEESEDIRKTMKIEYSLLKDAVIKKSEQGFVEMEAISTIGKSITLKDYAHLGKKGESYFTWLSISDHDLEPIAFSKDNVPQWINPPEV